MFYKWLCLILLIIIIYLLRCYWFPILEKYSTNNSISKSSVSTEIIYNDTLNHDLNWAKSKGVMPFIGSLDYQKSRKFYGEIGFKVEEGDKHCKVFINNELSFWLQNYANKQWLDNSMIFLDVPNLEKLKKKLKSLRIEEKYKNVKISETKLYDWGIEFFMHDPSGVLWHFCEYKSDE